MKNFNEEELCQMVFNDYDGFEVIDTIEGTVGRWTRHMTTILKSGDKFYAIEWEQGLTEYQENEFYFQPYEVEPYEEVITILKYKPKEVSNGKD